jgi:hypothetical protein
MNFGTYIINKTTEQLRSEEGASWHRAHEQMKINFSTLRTKENIDDK